MWMLVLVVILNGIPTISNQGTFKGMDKCFEKREFLKRAFTAKEHFPPNHQAICIRTSKNAQS